jgi:hypothetical protein
VKRAHGPLDARSAKPARSNSTASPTARHSSPPAPRTRDASAAERASDQLSNSDWLCVRLKDTNEEILQKISTEFPPRLKVGFKPLIRSPAKNPTAGHIEQYGDLRAPVLPLSDRRRGVVLGELVYTSPLARCGAGGWLDVCVSGSGQMGRSLRGRDRGKD